MVFRIFCLISLLSPAIILCGVEGKKDEWYQACDGTTDECGYSKKSSSKSTCHDDHESCRDFALAGECLANPDWMELNCRRSCGLCSTEEILNDADEDCADLHTSCPKWAGELECYTNPAYMSRACPKSCWLCVNATDLAENDGLDQETVNHRILFANTDFGLWQSIPQDDPGDTVRMEIAKMGLYVKTLESDKIGPGTMCNNRYHECSQWVISKGCTGEELDFMLTYCSLACQQCDIVEDYQRCRHTPERDLENHPLYGNSNEILVHLTETLGGTNLLEDHQLDGDNQDGEEWILSLERKVLWDEDFFTTQSLIQEIVTTIKGLEWKNASAKDYVDSPSDPIPDRSGRTVVCDSKCESANNGLKLLHNKIATMLKVDTKYVMPLEFVHYKRNERFAPHHDYRLHDSWKHSGRRAISVFIGLQSPTKGGSFGFPDLDWLLVEKPQILVWPNISPKNNQAVAIGKMTSEQLPVVEGELYGIYTWVREYPYDDNSPCS